MLEFVVFDWSIGFDLRAVAVATLIAVMAGAALARLLIGDDWRRAAYLLAWLFLSVNIWLGVLQGIASNAAIPPGPGSMLGIAAIHGLIVGLVFLRTNARVALIVLLAIAAGGVGHALFI